MNGKMIALIILLVILFILLVWWVLSCQWGRTGSGSGGNGGGCRSTSSTSNWSFGNLFSMFPYKQKSPINRQYKQLNVDSDILHTALNVNVNTLNSWGVRSHTWVVDTKCDATVRLVYVVNNATSTIQAFSADKTDTLLATYIVPPVLIGGPNNSPTGITVNSSQTGFLVSGQDSTVLSCTESGQVWALVPTIDPVNLQLVIDNSGNSTVYKGLHMTRDFLYVANFASGFVEVYDTTFTFVQQFTDPDLQSVGYAPFNVYVHKKQVIVSFAKQDTVPFDDVPGIGNGYIDTFSLTGLYESRLVDRGHLNSPWNLTVVESTLNCKNFVLLVGQHGDGTIQSYNLKKGTYLGPLLSCASEEASVIDGLWGIDIQWIGKKNNLHTTIYFGAGIQNETHGLYGKLISCS